jgi:superfamily II DNA or RNA helicase
MFKFRQFQKEDIAVAAMHDGAIIAWDPGMGKTMALFSWPILKQARRVLIVAPGSLHEQICTEGRTKFKVECTVIRDQEVAADLIRRRILPTATTPANDDDAPYTGMPQFFIVDYRWLGYNGADEWKQGAAPEEGLDEDEKTEACSIHRMSINNPIHRLRLMTSKGVGIADYQPDLFDGIGLRVRDIQCVHIPTLATMIQDSFDCVVCDEAVRLKAGVSHNANGVLSINSRYRLALTGTPIKNKLPDLFFLACWVTGFHAGPTARWPYAGTTEDRAEFAKAHSILEENLSAWQRTRRRSIRVTNKICNLHRLWKLLAPIIVRRRKDQIGADLVTKTIIPISIQPGTAQQRTYSYALDQPAEKASILATLGAQLAELRQAASCPDSPMLRQRSTAHTPKLHAILTLCADILERGEQVVIFSPYQHLSTTISDSLKSAGIKHAMLDGRTNPTRRGQLAATFKAKEFPILICGMSSMGEGHSFDQCPNLILPSVEWAYDVNAQAIERVHRLTSQKPVNIYCFVTKGTIDEKLAAVFAEKGDSSDLALDGKLSEKVTEELNLADLLNAAIENFSPNQETIDEHTLIAAYPTTILPRLLSAQETWRSQNAATPIIAAPVNNVTKVKTVTTPAPAPAPAPVTNKLTILLRNPAFSRFLASA